MRKDKTQAARPRVLPQQSCKTRDGAELCTDIFLPEATEPASTVVIRTPYGRSNPAFLSLALALSRSGFVVALQDCRGRYQSTGTLDWLKEEADTRDTLAWLADQTFSDGRFGLIGMSISSHHCFPVAADPPEGSRVDALVNIMGVVDVYSLFHQQHALVLHWALPWTHAMAGQRMPPDLAKLRPWEELYRHLPLADIADRDSSELDLSLWKDVTTRPADDVFWDRLDVSPSLDYFDVPTLHVAGWYDFLLGQSLDVYEKIVRCDRDGRGQQRLVIGPWDHQGFFTPSGAGAIDSQALLVDWFGRHLTPEDRPSTASARATDVTVFVMGEDRWVGLDAWPGGQPFDHHFFLSTGSEAAGGGSLVTDVPPPGSDLFDYDPTDPVPTRGGVLWPFHALGLEAGRLDQSDVEDRGDVLLYTTAPLEEELLIVGRVVVELWVASSAPTTDFTAKLVDVDIGGTSWVVCDGIVRVDFGDAEEDSAPRRVRIDLRGTGQRFEPGHRLRLQISSSNFPQYDRSLNGAAFAGTTARQEVFLGGDHASRLCVHASTGEELASRPPPGSAALV